MPLATPRRHRQVPSSPDGERTTEAKRDADTPRRCARAPPVPQGGASPPQLPNLASDVAEKLAAALPGLRWRVHGAQLRALQQHLPCDPIHLARITRSLLGQTPPPNTPVAEVQSAILIRILLNVAKRGE